MDYCNLNSHRMKPIKCAYCVEAEVERLKAEVEKRNEFIEYVRDGLHLAVSPELRIIARQLLAGEPYEL